MENASKALIIAGAILISILIVGLGVIIYNNVAGTAKSSNLDEQAITAHNQPFESYFGKTVSGANVKALLTKAAANNNAAIANEEPDGNLVFFKVDVGESAVDGYRLPQDVTNYIKAGKTYEVRIEQSGKYDDKFKVEADGYVPDPANATSYWKNGYIKTIEIKVN